MGRIVSNLLSKGETTYANTAEALKSNGLDWGVTKRPLFARIPSEDDPSHGMFKRADNLYGIVRDDTNKTLGVATARYNTIPNLEGFAPLDVLTDEGRLKLIGAGELDGGAKVFIQATLPDFMRIAGERVDHNVLAMMTHDGKGSTFYRSMPNRFFCTNQLRALLRGNGEVKVNIRHTASSGDRVREAHEIIRKVYLNQDKFIQTAEQLLSLTFTRDEMAALVTSIMPRPDASDPNTTDRMVRNWEDRFVTIMQDAYGAPDLNDIRYTGWGALNAVADYEQHHIRMRGNAMQREEALLTRTFEDGPLARAAFERLIERV